LEAQVSGNRRPGSGVKLLHGSDGGRHYARGRRYHQKPDNKSQRQSSRQYNRGKNVQLVCRFIHYDIHCTELLLYDM